MRASGRTFLRFVLANSLAALVNILVRLGASLVLADGWAVAAGFVAGLSSSYLLCRGFVFRVGSRVGVGEILRFTGINLVALAITWAVYQFSLGWTRGLPLPSGLARTLAHAIGVVAPVLFSFIAQKTFTFGQGITRHAAQS